MARVSDHFFLKFLVLVVQNTGVFEQIGDFEGLGRPHARNCKCTIVEKDPAAGSESGFRPFGKFGP